MKNTQKGFTLVEILVVIALIAVLAVAVILTLNPAELLKQARDSTRVSDLAAINSALSLYYVDVSSPTSTPTANCYVHASSGASLANCQSRFASGITAIVTSSSQAINGTGWIPINLSTMSIGTTLPRYPVDPTNSNVYFYAFRSSSTVGFYEINAVLESNKYLQQSATDGGNSSTVYEVGSDLNL